LPLPQIPDLSESRSGKVRQFFGLLGSVPRSRLALVAALMLAAALSEGTGIALLIPMLEFTGAGQSQSRTVGLFAASGLIASLGLLLALFVALVAVRAALVYFLGRLRHRLQMDFADGLRIKCYAALLHANWRWLANQRSADHNAALVTNSMLAGTVLDQSLGLASTFVTASILLAISFAVSWQVTLLAVVLAGTMLAILAPAIRKAQQIGRSAGSANRALHRQVEHGVAQFRETKIHGNEHGEAKRFETIIAAIGARKIALRDNAAMGTALIQLGGAAMLALMVYAGQVWFELELVLLLPLLLIFLRLIPLLQAAQQALSQWLHALPALHELQQLAAMAEAQAEPELALAKPPRLGREIVVDAATVVHPQREKPALDRANLTIPAGSIVAITGQSGAGKSTLADVIGGLIEPDSGSVMIDRTALAGAAMRGWRNSVAYVQQSPLLVHGTVRDNLLWAHPEANEADLATALTMASADFVMGLPEGLGSNIGDGGLRLSGGERQRIALARALLRSPQLLILDEFTSALDAENEAAVLKAIAAMRGQLTIMMIGHRPAMLALADRVVEMRDGRIVSEAD
jgi:ATP-binding cassette subfamily C protein